MVKNTICALATPIGKSAIAVIRLSGAQSKEITFQCCPSLLKKGPIKSHTVHLSKLIDKSGELIDQVVVSVFDHGKSYTGEQCVEISCHGSPYIVKKIISRLVECGARLANPGEFTYRAFINEKIDLVQAEGVLSVIESDSEKSMKLGQRLLEGRLSESFSEIVSDLTWCLAHVEASIDFSTEGLETIDQNLLIKKLMDLELKLNALNSSFKSGRAVRDGLLVAIVGRPNAGKSSLLNCFLQSDRAIVSATPGTTRDVIEGVTHFRGLKIRLNDTAGVREAQDEIEKIGISLTKKTALEADLILYIFDASLGLFADEIQWLKTQKIEVPIITISNKNDLLLKKVKNSDTHTPVGVDTDMKTLFVSAHDPGAREVVLASVVENFLDNDSEENILLSSARQHELCVDAVTSLSEAIIDLKGNIGAEFVSQRLKGSLVFLQKILGVHYDDQILDRVFKEFCLGK